MDMNVTALVIEGDLFIKGSNVVKKWKKRFCVLQRNPSMLGVYETNTKKKLVQSFELKSGHKVLTVTESGSQNDQSIKISTKGKKTKFFVFIKLENRSQFVLQAGDSTIQMMWAQNIQTVILITQPRSSRAMALYHDYYSIQEIEIELQKILAVLNKVYKGDGVAFVRKEDVTTSNQKYDRMNELLSFIDDRFGKSCPHWKGIQAKYLLLVPRMGEKIRLLTLKFAVHKCIHDYTIACKPIESLLNRGKVNEAMQKWAVCLKLIENLLADSKFRVRKSSKNSEKFEIPDIEIFSIEHNERLEHIQKLYSVAQEKKSRCEEVKLADNVQRVLLALHQRLVPQLEVYYPPYTEHDSGGYVSEKALEDIEALTNTLRNSLDSFMTSINKTNTTTEENDQISHPEWRHFIVKTKNILKKSLASMEKMKERTVLHKIFREFQQATNSLYTFAHMGQLDFVKQAWISGQEYVKKIEKIGGSRYVLMPVESMSEDQWLMKSFSFELKANKRPMQDDITGSDLQIFEEFFKSRKKDVISLVAKINEEKCSIKNNGTLDSDVDPHSPESTLKRVFLWVNKSMEPSCQPLFCSKFGDNGSSSNDMSDHDTPILSRRISVEEIAFSCACLDDYDRKIKFFKGLYGDCTELTQFFSDSMIQYTQARKALSSMITRRNVQLTIGESLYQCKVVQYFSSLTDSGQKHMPAYLTFDYEQEIQMSWLEVQRTLTELTKLQSDILSGEKKEARWKFFWNL